MSPNATADAPDEGDEGDEGEDEAGDEEAGARDDEGVDGGLEHEEARHPDGREELRQEDAVHLFVVVVVVCVRSFMPHLLPPELLPIYITQTNPMIAVPCA